MGKTRYVLVSPKGRELYQNKSKDLIVKYFHKNYQDISWAKAQDIGFLIVERKIVEVEETELAWLRNAAQNHSCSQCPKCKVGSITSGWCCSVCGYDPTEED